jgi:hypothetical protein
MSQEDLDQLNVSISVKKEEVKLTMIFFFVLALLLFLATVGFVINWLWKKLKPFLEYLWNKFLKPILKLAWDKIIALLMRIPDWFWDLLVALACLVLIIAAYKNLRGEKLGVLLAFIGWCMFSGELIFEFIKDRLKVDVHRHQVAIYSFITLAGLSWLFTSMFFFSASVVCAYIAVGFTLRRHTPKEQRTEEVYFQYAFFVSWMGAILAAFYAVIPNSNETIYAIIALPGLMGFSLAGPAVARASYKSNKGWLYRQVPFLGFFVGLYSCHTPIIAHQVLAVGMIVYLGSKILDLEKKYKGSLKYSLFCVSLPSMAFALYTYFHPDYLHKFLVLIGVAS